MGQKEKNPVTIRGFVVAMDWDDEDRPLSVAIQTEDYLEVLVEEGGVGGELLDLEDAEVEVRGVLDETDPDSPSISVRAFDVLEDPDAALEEGDEEAEEEVEEEEFEAEEDDDFAGQDDEEDDEFGSDDLDDPDDSDEDD